MKALMSRLGGHLHEVVLAALVLLALIVLSRQSANFLTIDNLLNQGRLIAEIGLVALAMTFVIITGGIDLSVGSILGLVAVLLGAFWQNLELPLPLAIVLAMIVGTLAGAINGLIITRFKVPPLIATLATLALYRGLAEGISQARSVRGFPDWFYVLGQGDLFGVPVQLWVLLLIVLLTAAVLSLTTWGRATYAMGANETGARFSGLAVDRGKLAIYAFSGFCASLAAVIFVSRVSTTRSDMGTGLELDVITAVVLGGTSIMGGKGSVARTLLGVFFLRIVNDGMNILNVSVDIQLIAKGAVIVVALGLASWER